MAVAARSDGARLRGAGFDIRLVQVRGDHRHSIGMRSFGASAP